MKCCERGRSMIEMLGVLAIVGVLSVGGISGYTKAMSKYKLSTLTYQLHEIVLGVRTFYMQQDNFSNINVDSLIIGGAVPKDLINKDKSPTAEPILHKMGGTIRFFPSLDVDHKERAFEMYVTHLDHLACTHILTMDWGRDPASGFIALYVGTGDVTEALMKNIYTGADTNPEAGIYTCGQHELSLPLPVAYANAACACDGNDCLIGLKYM